MNSLMTTHTFDLIDKTFDIKSKVKSANQWIDKYVIDRDKYDYLIQVSKTFRYPLVNNVVTALERGEVKPVMYECPKNNEDKAITFPTSISGILVSDANKKIISYVDTSPHGRYVRNNIDKNEIQAYGIEEKHFFAYAQRGYIGRILTVNNNQLDTTPMFVKAVVNAYARLLAKPISAVYATGAKDEWMQKLLYVTIVFALQNFFNYNQEKARQYALSFPGIARSYIMENSKFYNCKNYEIVDMTYDGVKKAHPNDPNINYPVDVYVQILKSEFEEMRNGKIEFRTIFDRYTSMYGQNSMLSIEHCGSFINMILSAEFKIKLYNDLGITNICKDDIDTITGILQMIKSK